MKKIRKLTFEAWWALRSFRNPLTYFRSRAGLSSDNEVILRLRNNISYFVRTDTREPILLDEIWHERLYDFFERYIRKDSVVLDIGGILAFFR